jgi:hypothetical protein
MNPMERTIAGVRGCRPVAAPRFEKQCISRGQQVTLVFFEKMQRPAQDMDQFPRIDHAGRVGAVPARHKPACESADKLSDGRANEDHGRNRTAIVGKLRLVKTESA